MTSRGVIAVVVALAAFATAPIEGHSVVDPTVALAEGSDVRVGDRLVAVVDVELDAAVVRAGSHVSVVARKKREGRLTFDVALADGHVVKAVPLQRLRSSFRVA
jgi:hypothetical protein